MAGSLSGTYRLGDLTVAEPLVHRWYAYPYNFSPVPAALHLAAYQIPLLDSYIQRPQMHESSARDKKMLGWPIADIPAKRVDEVKQLRAETLTREAPKVAFAAAWKSFDALLASEAKGQSIESFYAKMPEPLRGVTELAYDYHNHPLLRFIESSAYRSPLYDPSLQSLRLFREQTDDGRKFFLSTPRLDDPESLVVTRPFADPHVDELFSLEDRPRPLGEIAELLGVGEDKMALLTSLLEPSTEPRPKAPRYSGEGVRIRYFGHASVLLESKTTSILVDANVAGPLDTLERFSFPHLPEKIDYVLITHSHSDHYVFETLLRLRRRIGTIVVPRNHGVFHGDISLRLLSEKLGFKRVLELESWDTLEFDGGDILSLPFLGEHCDLVHAKSAWVVRFGGEQILLAADSNCLDVRIYDELRRARGPVKTAFVGMECDGGPLGWQYGSILPFRPGKQEEGRKLSGSNAAAAMELCRAIGAERFYVYAMGLEPWMLHIMALAMSDDSFQMKEVKKAFADAPSFGVHDTKLLFGKFELNL